MTQHVIIIHNIAIGKYNKIYKEWPHNKNDSSNTSQSSLSYSHWILQEQHGGEAPPSPRCTALITKHSCLKEGEGHPSASTHIWSHNGHRRDLAGGGSARQRWTRCADCCLTIGQCVAASRSYRGYPAADGYWSSARLSPIHKYR